DQLLYKYPNIHFINNPLYNEANNISSILCARHLLQNAYVLEGDLLLYNPALIRTYQYRSNYLGVPVEKTDDWCLVTNSQGYVKKMAIGGTDCYHMYGISYWNDQDGAALCKHIEAVYESPGGKERYWDQVPLEFYLSSYKVYVRECTFEDITEIDAFSELKKLDPSYDI
ncbi:MAG: CTP--phosphocholine cytidylyltransferase, partial [Clostridia bacterium]|nr:CTP--phosphocholine cytidylyltransferase [Clostridia bacterium]